MSHQNIRPNSDPNSRPQIGPILVILAIVGAAAAGLLAMGRPPICTCGTIDLWHPALDAGNSQHVADWYTPSHVIHGFLFYAIGHWLLRRRPGSVRLTLAVVIEAGWELLENSPAVIDRYRTATMALGYTGDSVLNSVADIGWMAAGFLIAGRLPVMVTVALAIGFELLTLVTIRDNLTLNVLMLVAPIDAIRLWQGAQ
ncbi:DUF2585 domain-containing protein [Sphingomonas montana]|uniref:DUF2585 domain-containing protein n=1 Tax=Sphingomonas montana TaxID=1843236 RepID=UPI00096DF4EC|nr:DUF2585 domain-containing protein [Sphingomonas montana]